MKISGNYSTMKPEEISLETNITGATPVKVTSRRLSVFRYNKKALLITGVTLIAIILIGGVSSLFITGHAKNTAQTSAESGYKVTTPTPTTASGTAAALQIIQADHLVINGQLKVTNSLILSPQSSPANPTVGQLYFDKTINAPYFYNGSTFISLLPTVLPQQITSLQGQTKLVDLRAGSGNANTIALFTGSQAIADSILSQDAGASTLTVAGALRNVTDSAVAFQIQSAAGASVLTASTITARIGINNTLPAYALDVSGDINSSTAVRVGGITVCASGACIPTSGSNNYIQNGANIQVGANFSIRSAAANTVTAVLQSANGQTADLLQLQTWDGTNAQLRAGFNANGKLSINGATGYTAALTIGTTAATTAADGISFGGDTNLYRSSSGTLTLQSSGTTSVLQSADASGSNAAGQNFVLAGGIGTGNGPGGGIALQIAPLMHANANESFITGASIPTAVYADNSYIYWANVGTGSIYRANLDGSNVIPNFIRATYGVIGVSGDATHLYWTNNYYNPGVIGRANLDGSNIIQNFITGANFPDGIAVTSSYIYWRNLGTTSIGRANLDGSNVNFNFIPVINNGLTGLTTDSTYIYWTNGNGNMGRANLDGTNINQSFIVGVDYNAGIGLDGSFIYWSNFFANTIGRANLDGSNVSQSFIKDAAYPRGMSVNGSYLYWANQGSNTIARNRIYPSTTPNSLTTVASISGLNGAALFQNATNSTTAFQIQNAAGSSLLRVDSSNNLVVQGSSTTSVFNLASPGIPTLTCKPSGGTLVDGTYAYRIGASDTIGATIPGAEASCAITGGSGVGSVSITWAVVPGAKSYNVYGRTTGTELLITTVGATTNTFIDTGSIIPAGSMPIVTNAYTNRLSAVGNSYLLGGNVGIGTATPTAVLQVVGSQPVDTVGTYATNGLNTLQVTGATGGSTSVTTIGVGGGGGVLNLVSGAGGVATSALAYSIGGNAGSLNLNGGAGGAAAVAGTGRNYGGTGGVFSWVAGTGGAATGATSGYNIAGGGGIVTLQGGTGGAANSGATSSYNLAGGGGSINIQAGTGGAATTGSGALYGGAGGNLTLQAGTGGIGTTYSGTGGTTIIQGGSPAAVAGAVGGSVTVAGHAGSTIGSGGSGGAVNIVGGAANGDNSTNQQGGLVSITAGTSKGASSGGAISLTSGDGGKNLAAGLIAGPNSGNILLSTGNAGTAPNASILSVGGTAGTLALQGGTGGAAAVAGTGNNYGGTGSTLNFSAGTGGAAAGATSGYNIAGGGGSINIQAGTGGAATTGSGALNGGAGGNLTLQAGTGGTGTNGGIGGATTLQAGTSAGTNIVGGTLTIAGGIGTGTGNGGTINLRIAKPGVSSGSGANGLVTVASLSGINGAAIFSNAVNSTTAFQIQNNIGAALFIADTTNMKLTVTSLVVNVSLKVNGHIVSGNSSGTTTGTGLTGACSVAGTSPTITGNDTAGLISYTTANSGACAGAGVAGTLLQVNFSTSFASPPNVVITPASSNISALQSYIDPANVSITAFKISVNQNPVLNATYKFYYHVIQ